MKEGCKIKNGYNGDPSSSRPEASPRPDSPPSAPKERASIRRYLEPLRPVGETQEYQFEFFKPDIDVGEILLKYGEELQIENQLLKEQNEELWKKVEYYERLLFGNE